jgi:hypothetical protein
VPAFRLEQIVKFLSCHYTNTKKVNFVEGKTPINDFESDSDSDTEESLLGEMEIDELVVYYFLSPFLLSPQFRDQNNEPLFSDSTWKTLFSLD